MVYGKCDECGQGRIPLFSVKHGKVTRLPGLHPRCAYMAQLRSIASRATAVLVAK